MPFQALRSAGCLRTLARSSCALDWKGKNPPDVYRSGQGNERGRTGTSTLLLPCFIVRCVRQDVWVIRNSFRPAGNDGCYPPLMYACASLRASQAVRGLLRGKRQLLGPRVHRCLLSRSGQHPSPPALCCRVSTFVVSAGHVGYMKLPSKDHCESLDFRARFGFPVRNIVNQRIPLTEEAQCDLRRFAFRAG